MILSSRELLIKEWKLEKKLMINVYRWTKCSFDEFYDVLEKNINKWY
jgi:hypothetical protein